MKKIIFATTNEGKMREVRMILNDLNCEVLSLKDIGLDVDVVEDGETFEDNALIKARAIMELTGEMVLADDSGLEVDYMNKEPGIYSARFLGESTPYHEKNQYIIERLKDAKEQERSARFVCAIAFVSPVGEVMITRGTIEGEIGYEEKGANGFGYDPIFVVPEFQCTSAELLPEQKNLISHRGKALSEMKEMIKKYLE